MARRSNKTDHVLNLLSTGSKKQDAEAGENAAPPVALKKGHEEQKEQIEEKEPIEQEESKEPKEEQEEPQAEIAEEKDSGVSVVHMSADGDNPIGDAVKNSLEEELGAYLGESEEPQLEEKTEQEIPEMGVEAQPLAEEEPAAAEPTAVSEEEPEKSEPVQQETAPELEQVEPEREQPESQPEQTASEPQQPEPEPVVASEEEPEKSEPVQQETAPEPEQPEPQPEQTASEPQPVAASEEEPEKSEPVQQETVPEPKQPEPEPMETQPAEVQEQAQEPKAEQEPEVKLREMSPEEIADEESSYGMLNVMERLVRDKAEGYMDQFGTCPCRRCREDIIALSLTHLPAKYVVADKNALSPLLSFYEKRYAGQVTVELTKACIRIKEHPHH